MDSVIPVVAIALVVVAALLSMVRIAIGPSLIDRAVGLEVFTLCSVGFITLHGVHTQQVIFYDVLMLWALFAFLATSALGLYLYQRKRQ